MIFVLQNSNHSKKGLIDASNITIKWAKEITHELNFIKHELSRNFEIFV